MTKHVKIESLTPAQIARFPEFIERWTRIGLDTSPADRPRAERAIAAMYAGANLAVPRIVWCGSPISQAITRAIVQKIGGSKDSVGASVGASVLASVWASVLDSVWASVLDSVGASVGASVRDSVGASVRSSVWASVLDSVGASVRDSVGASVRDSVGASVGASVRDSVGASVRSSVGASVRDSVGASVRDSVGASGFGQHDANWIGFYAFFREVLGLTTQTKALIPLTELTESAGWFLPHKNICWVSERHNDLHKNAEGQLHREDGPAVQYTDGWQLWRIAGIEVDEQIVMRPETQNLKQIEDEQNEEVRRIRIERFGWPRYIAESNAECMEVRRNDIDATREALIRMRTGEVRLLCACRSNGRVYAVGVPREIKTCREAQNWMAQGSSVLAGRKVNIIGAS